MKKNSSYMDGIKSAVNLVRDMIVVEQCCENNIEAVIMKRFYDRLERHMCEFKIESERLSLKRSKR